MLNEQDLKNLLAFLNRVDLKGNEALVLAQLQQKIVQQLQPVEEAITENNKTE